MSVFICELKLCVFDTEDSLCGTSRYIKRLDKILIGLKPLWVTREESKTSLRWNLGENLCGNSTMKILGNILFSVSVLWSSCTYTGGKSPENISIELQALTTSLFHNYDPTIRPFYTHGGPVVDKIQIYILSIDSVSEANMDYKMSMFFRQSWNDSRLMHEAIDDKGYLEMDTRHVSSLWIPDLYIRNEKAANFHHVTVPNSLIYIYPDGTVYFSRRITGTFSCFMKLHSYPLDEQVCRFEVESYGHSADFLYVKWHDVPVKRVDGLVSPQFEIGDVSSYNCNEVYNDILYSCVGFNIQLSRNYGYYLIQVYIPTSLIVMLSWVSFWLNIDAVPARISLGLLTVLTMTTMSSSARSELPRVSYIKAIDVWMAICLLFVFAALIQFAHVNVLSRVERRRRESVVEFKKTDENGSSHREVNQKEKPGVAAEAREKARTADRIARIAFPLTFLVFNLAYWPVYLVWDNK
ncbi:glycine receptor subunit alpha-2-like [Argopecten irradians]|uniref:glycine receptor subunit alpha-2-like n=1 Tax=Argopecten irradians TaxID=31199 RepID=UPI003710862B